MRFYSLFWHIFIVFLIIFASKILFSEKQTLSIFRTILFGIAPIIISIIFLLLRKNKNLIIILSNSFILCFVVICFFEIYLINRNVIIEKIVVNEDLKKKHICGNSLRNINDLKIYPVGGVSKKKIKFVNVENFSYSFRENDRYGFNNDNEVWNKTETHSVFLGDSFTYGANVNYNENFVELYKKKFDQSINLACGGNGPLIEYAAFIEYVVKKKLKPKYLYWVYYSGNDLTKNLGSEFSSFYKNYLTKNFHQNLLTRQSEIDDVLNKYSEEQIKFKNENTEIIVKDKKIDFKDFYKFTKIRTLIGVKHAYKKENFEIFKKIIESTNEYVQTWEGELIFVIIPSQDRYLTLINYYDQFYYDEPIKKYLKEKRIKLIDLNKSLIKNKNSRDYYHGHLNIKGHILLYNQIINDLKL